LKNEKNIALSAYISFIEPSGLITTLAFFLGFNFIGDCYLNKAPFGALND
jgi:hypothetical protein